MFKSLAKTSLMFYILLMSVPLAMAEVEEYPLFSRLEQKRCAIPLPSGAGQASLFFYQSRLLIF